MATSGNAHDDGEPLASGPAANPPADTVANAPSANGPVGGSSIPTVHIREVRKGHRPGERYVRIHRPFHETFREAAPDTLVAREQVFEPRSTAGRVWTGIRRALIGRPLASAQLAHERISKPKALAVFASDALSSSAYATEEILRILVIGGALALTFTMPVALAIGALLAIVVISYRQTIKAYPNGGGSYIVSKDNLGTVPALVAASALLISYLLTVAVSISAGVYALTSAVPELYDWKVMIAVAIVALMTIINLRGVSESATIFAVPTYLFIVTALGMIAYGLFRLATGSLTPDLAAHEAELEAWEASGALGSLSLLLVLRAFAQGCAALTGTEAISDGVPAFKPPEWKNARATLLWMGIILAILFLGISFLATQLAIVPNVHEGESVVSMIARDVFGGGPLYYLMQAATMLILVLAANTAYADFPRLSWFLARDRFMPNQFSFRGDRLAFSTGITTLGILSALIVYGFEADTHALIPLYAIGVFVAFTCSQAGMVKRWWTRREPGWRYGLAINTVGAATTFAVAVIQSVAQFTHGAWMVIVLIPIQVWILWRIRAHYERVAEQLALTPSTEPPVTLPEPILVVPVPGLNRAVARTLSFARALSENVTAVHITDDLQAADELRRVWKAWGTDVPLVILESKYRALTGPLLHYLDAVAQRNPSAPITVVLAEY
ncbi:MAG: APC family permease, partial [Chloroflexota bacterium]|nr:APC family permease [Chloroflexota bacterium]